MGVCCSRRKPKVKAAGQPAFPQNSLTYGGPQRERDSKKTDVPLREICYVKMANAFSNMNLTKPVKVLVSRRRRRYVKDGYNLDLTYIRDDLIAMGFPAEKLEGVYRNHIDDVVKFLESKHKDHYRIYNLCSERTYDNKKFQSRVASFPFDDHTPPMVELMPNFCRDVHDWLSQHPKNVAVVHCKAGKGRTGVMICCYLMHCNQCPTADKALEFYGQARTEDRKGVTIPSQRRYVAYYEDLLRKNLKYEDRNLLLRKVTVTPAPNLTHQACYEMVVSTRCSRVYVSSDFQRSSSNLVLSVETEVLLTGDIRVEFTNKPKMKLKEKLLHFWFNTFFVSEGIPDDEVSNGNEEVAAERSQRARSCDATACANLNLSDTIATHLTRSNSLTTVQCSRPLVLRLSKYQLDKAHKDKQDKLYPPDFEVTMYFERVPNTDLDKPRPPPLVPPLNYESGSDDSDTSEADEEEWDSVDGRGSLVGRYRLLSETEMAAAAAVSPTTPDNPS